MGWAQATLKPRVAAPEMVLSALIPEGGLQQGGIPFAEPVRRTRQAPSAMLSGTLGELAQLEI